MSRKVYPASALQTKRDHFRVGPRSIVHHDGLTQSLYGKVVFHVNLVSFCPLSSSECPNVQMSDASKRELKIYGLLLVGARRQYTVHDMQSAS
jgi:hypothetical protein